MLKPCLNRLLLISLSYKGEKTKQHRGGKPVAVLVYNAVICIGLGTEEKR